MSVQSEGVLAPQFPSSHREGRSGVRQRQILCIASPSLIAHATDVPSLQRQKVGGLQVSIEVNHCLLATPGVQKKDIRRVISHYQALAQVENYVRRMPGVTREAVDDTAGAAKLVAQEGWRYMPCAPPPLRLRR